MAPQGRHRRRHHRTAQQKNTVRVAWVTHKHSQCVAWWGTGFGVPPRFLTTEEGMQMHSGHCWPDQNKEIVGVRCPHHHHQTNHCALICCGAACVPTRAMDLTRKKKAEGASRGMGISYKNMSFPQECPASKTAARGTGENRREPLLSSPVEKYYY
jgi:hypothetical protein